MDSEREYRDRVAGYVLQAIIDASRDPESGKVTIRNSDVFYALANVQSGSLAMADRAQTVGGMKAMVDEMASQLCRQALALQEYRSRGSKAA